MTKKIHHRVAGIVFGLAALTSFFAVPGSPQKESQGWPFVQTVYAQEGQHRRADLEEMGLLDFGIPATFDALGMRIMAFLGKSVVYASILGIMIGGIYLVFAGGDEGAVQRGKDIIIASLIGLIVTFSSYLIIKFVQEFIYAV